MKVQSLRLALMKLRPMLLDSMQDADADELDGFLASLEEHDASELRALTVSSTKKRAKATATKKSTSIKPTVTNAASYVTRLRATEDWPVEFASVINDLRTDKGARVGDIKAIANEYRGVEDRYKTKADALSAIEKHQLSRARGRTRQQHIREIF
jgi:hypothetical protein